MCALQRVMGAQIVLDETFAFLNKRKAVMVYLEPSYAFWRENSGRSKSSLEFAQRLGADKLILITRFLLHCLLA